MVKVIKIQGRMRKVIKISYQTGLDRSVHLLVENNAEPIPAALRQQLFARGMTTKGEQGSGLGLYISKRIAQRAQGDLELRLDHEQTCFDLKLEKAG